MVEPGVAGDEAELDTLKLSDFEQLDVQENLGKGSFGIVQKIKAKGSSKIYALKTMKKDAVIDGNLIEQVELEIDVQRKLKHRNVLRLYRHFEDADNVYLLLEFCAKGELYQLLRTQKNRRFTEDMACSFFCQAAEGLMYLHDQNVMHRDIKPENLLVTHDDVLKIADFGWCAESSVQRTTFCGTLDYLAPEMIQGKGHDHTLDVWSAGVLLYEMVVGRPPFQSTNHGQLITKILRLELSFPSFTTEWLEDLVKKVLQTEPRMRLSLKDALRHRWVMEHRGNPCHASPVAQNRQVATPSSTAPVQPVQASPQPTENATLNTPATCSPRPPLEQNSRQMQEQAPAAAPAAVTIHQTPAGTTRGLNSPRPPNGPQFQYVPQANLARPHGVTMQANGALQFAVSPVSPISTPLVFSRHVPQETPLVWESSAPGPATVNRDELSNSQRRHPKVASMEPRPMSVSRCSPMPVMMERVSEMTPAYTRSPPAAFRTLDTSTTTTAQQMKAVGTPGRREASRPRPRTHSPQPPELRDIRSDHPKAERQAMPSMMPSRGANGAAGPVPQRREASCVPAMNANFNHAPSQDVLQRGDRTDTRPPATPKAQTRRLSATQAASVSVGVAGAQPGRIPGARTALDVMVSPIQNSRMMSMNPERIGRPMINDSLLSDQAYPRNADVSLADEIDLQPSKFPRGRRNADDRPAEQAETEVPSARGNRGPHFAQHPQRMAGTQRLVQEQPRQHMSAPTTYGATANPGLPRPQAAMQAGGLRQGQLIRPGGYQQMPFAPSRIPPTRQFR